MEQKTAVGEKKIQNLEEIRSLCENQDNALACARYGYLERDIGYTRRACSLGHESSCFNLMEIEAKAPKQNIAIISYGQQLVYHCYVNFSIDKEREGEKEVNLIFVIDPMGNLKNLSVQGKQISHAFRTCVMKAFSSKKFMATEREQHINYGLVLPQSQKSDYRGDGGLFTGH